MDLLSLETNYEMSCLAKEMTSIKKNKYKEHFSLRNYILEMSLQNISFWTSGSSLSCPGNYAWCSVSELLNKEEHTWSAPSSRDKSCISLQTVNGTGVLVNDLCSSNKRAICEVNF
jgi:hypothetical protein